MKNRISANIHNKTCFEFHTRGMGIPARNHEYYSGSTKQKTMRNCKKAVSYLMEESNSQTVCPAESHFVEAKTRLANYVRDLLVRNGFYIFLEVLFKKKKENM